MTYGGLWYRGYRLEGVDGVEVHLYYGDSTSLVETTTSVQEAKDDIDAWHDAN